MTHYYPAAEDSKVPKSRMALCPLLLASCQGSVLKPRDKCYPLQLVPLVIQCQAREFLKASFCPPVSCLAEPPSQELLSSVSYNCLSWDTEVLLQEKVFMHT